jgi:hypothetical protein
MVMVTLTVGGCGGSATKGPESPDVSEVSQGQKAKVLTVRWQRLVDGGQTCDRCGSTEKELQEAVQSLKTSLRGLGIEVVLEKKSLDPAAFAKDVSQSNRIWIGKRTLEEWLGAKTGKSDCGFCYSAIGGKVECRTVVIDGQTYESIPAKLIVKAGLLAGADLLEVSSCGPGDCGPRRCGSGGCGPKESAPWTKTWNRPLDGK